MTLALWQWVVIFATSALVVMLAGTFLARAGDSIATRTRLGGPFVGVGNLFGSNAFNMTIVLWVDLAWTDGPVLDAISVQQLVPGIGAILMMALAIGAIVGGGGTRLRRGEPDAVLVLLAYVGLLGLSYLAGA